MYLGRAPTHRLRSRNDPVRALDQSLCTRIRTGPPLEHKVGRARTARESPRLAHRSLAHDANVHGLLVNGNSRQPCPERCKINLQTTALAGDPSQILEGPGLSRWLG